MARSSESRQNWARIALAIIRLFNGGMAMVAPGWLVRRLGVDPEKQGATYYIFRMFGIRTVLVGLELLSQDEGQRARSLRAAPLIHASDTLAALLAGLQGRLPRRGAMQVVILSAINTTLAVIAQVREK